MCDDLFRIGPVPFLTAFFLLFSTLFFPPSKKKNKIGTTSLHSKQQNKRCRTTKAVLTSTLTTIYSPVQTCVFIYIIYIYIYIYLSSLSLFFLSNFVICFLLIFSSSSTPLNRTPLTLVILIPSTKTMQSDVVTKYKIAADCVNGMFCFE